jgi:hypothetical protein
MQFGLLEYKQLLKKKFGLEVTDQGHIVKATQPTGAKSKGYTR